MFLNGGEVIPSEALARFLENTQLTNHRSMTRFFKQLQHLLQADVTSTNFLESDSHKQVVLLIDEFDGIPPTIVSDFLYSLRRIYLSDEMHCPHSVGIVGVKNIAQLDYDSSVSPFNIQDEFKLPNFTREEVQELFGQYTAEVGQPFTPEVINAIHKQTAGQPFPCQSIRTNTHRRIRHSENGNNYPSAFCHRTHTAP